MCGRHLDLGSRLRLGGVLELELRSEPERMGVLAAALEALVTAVARSREIAERARMNGKLIIGDA